MQRDRSIRKIAVDLCFVSLVYLLMVIPHWGFVPVWDSGCYWWECIKPTLGKPLDLMAFSCMNHPNIGFFAPLGLLARYAPWSHLSSIQSVSIAFGWVTILLLYLLTYALAREEFGRRLLALSSSMLLVVQPVFLANVINFSPEMGSTAYYVGTLWALFSGRKMVAGMFGTGLVLTKEPMILLYFGSALLWVTLEVIEALRRRTSSIFGTIKKVVCENSALTIPLFVLLLYAAIRLTLYDAPLYFGARDANSSSIFWTLLSFDFSDPKLLSILYLIYVSGFMWIITGLAALFPLLVSKRISTPQAAKTYFTFCVLTIFCFYSMTRFVPFTNARYALPLLPPLLVWFVFSIHRLIAHKVLRASVILAVGGLLFVSIHTSNEPFSVGRFGTFKFGESQMYRVTSASSECCGYGRDQLMYNLQFTKILALQDQILARIKPTPETLLVYHDATFFFITSHLDPKTFNRSLDETELLPRYLSHNQLFGLKEAASDFFFIEMPNADHTDFFSRVGEHYDLISKDTVADGHYQMSFYHFRARNLSSHPT